MENKGRVPNFVTINEIEALPEEYSQFDYGCTLPEDLDVETISDTEASIVYLMLLRFCKN